MRAEMSQQPIVVVASLLSLGVALGWLVYLDWWWLALLGVALVGLYIYSRRWWMAMVLLLYGGFATTMICRLSSGDISGEGMYSVELRSICEGELRGVMSVDSRLEEGENEWVSCSGEVRYRGLEAADLRVGERLIVWGRVWEFRGRYYMNLSDESVVSREQVSGGGGESWSRRVNGWAVGRLERLGLDREAEAICKAMLLGRRESLSGELVEEYRRSGAAHILALSGLHVMIVYLLFGRLFMLLNLIPFGFRVRPLLLALVVWCYAMVVGMAPSVERAALMFVIMQVLRFVGHRYYSVSGLMMAVAIMVVVDPRVVYDVGFLLSVVAVVSILVWVVPIDRRVSWWCRGRFGRGVLGWGVKGLVSIFLVGVVCSLSTLPLVSWAFGYLSPMGVLLNPLVVITAYLLLTLSLLWVMVGFEAVAPLFRWLIDRLAFVQCESVDFMSSGWRDAVDVRLDLLSVVVIYLLYIAMSVAVWRKRGGLNSYELNN